MPAGLSWCLSGGQLPLSDCLLGSGNVLSKPMRPLRLPGCGPWTPTIQLCLVSLLRYQPLQSRQQRRPRWRRLQGLSGLPGLLRPLRGSPLPLVPLLSLGYRLAVRGWGLPLSLLHSPSLPSLQGQLRPLAGKVAAPLPGSSCVPKVLYRLAEELYRLARKVASPRASLYRRPEKVQACRAGTLCHPAEKPCRRRFERMGGPRLL